jgi:hypothetical protein
MWLIIEDFWLNGWGQSTPTGRGILSRRIWKEMINFIKQSSTSRSPLFCMLDSTDHVSPKTGLSPTVVLSKNGAAFGSPAGAVTELANGWYKVAGNATDSNTLGPLILHASATGADPTDVVFEVVAFDTSDAAALGLTNVDATISSRQPSGPVALTTGAIQSIWDALTSALVTTGSIGKWIVDKLDVTVSSRLAAVDYTSPGAAAPTVEEITGAVWSEPIPGSYTTDQAGGKLNALGNAADPLLNTVPGGYASGTAGYALGRLVAASISVTAPVLSSGNVQIVRGDSYFSADGRALVWILTGLPTINLTGAITTFKAKNISSILTKTSSDTPGIRAVFNSGTLTLTLELASTDTGTLNATTYDFDIQTLFSNGHVDTWVMGKMVVVADVR